MQGALKLVTPPESEPVSLDEAKSHLRVDGDSEDLLISSLIIAARQMTEKLTGRIFLTQTWDLWLDAVPSSRKAGSEWWEGLREGPLTDLTQVCRVIEIPKPPLQSVSFFKTYDTANTETTFDAANYHVDAESAPGRLALGYGKTWPTTILRPVNGIQIRFVAGYGAASAVPQPIKQAILMLVGHWFENREAIATSSIGPEVALGVRALLQPYEVVRL